MEPFFNQSVFSSALDSIQSWRFLKNSQFPKNPRKKVFNLNKILTVFPSNWQPRLE